MALMQQYEQRAESIPLLDKDRYTEAEYLAFEQQTEGRWEFVPTNPLGLPGPRVGIIRAMSGGTPDHSAIASNTITALTNALRAKDNRICRVFSSDLKIHTTDGLISFPDASVVCGKLGSHRGRRDIVTNPILLVEVLSPSTEAYDRGDKWGRYQNISTLRHYMLISATEPRVELYTREEESWRFQVFSGKVALALPALDIELSLADIYDLIEFEAES